MRGWALGMGELGWGDCWDLWGVWFVRDEG